MSAQTALLSIPPRASQTGAQSRLAAMAGSGFFEVGVPVRLGGHGGHLEDLFREPSARHWLQGLHHADLLLFHSQRLVIEALVRTDNIGLLELQLPDLLAGTMAGASALESPALEAQAMGLGWQFHGQLRSVPNLQWDGFSLLLPVQAAGRIEGLLLVRSEESGLTVRPSETPALWALAACGDLHFDKAFLRADEWLGDQPLWETLTQANQLLRDGLRHIHHR
jgi:hypothetical protein